MDMAEAMGRLRSLLEKAIEEEGQAPAAEARPRSKDSTPKGKGILLSGGLDTSIIALLAKRRIPALIAFTVTLKGFDNDLGYARRVAQLLGLEHHVYEFDGEELMAAAAEAAAILESARYGESIPSHIEQAYMEGYTEQVGPTTFAPLYIAMRFARGYVSLLYVGDGADELFTGYDSLVGILDLVAGARHSPFGPGFAGELERELSSRVFTAYDLRYPYRLAEALGIRVVAPFLSPEVCLFARSLPLEQKVGRQGGKVWGKWLLRKAFQDHLPAEIVWREKTTIDRGSGAEQVTELGRLMGCVDGKGD